MRRTERILFFIGLASLLFGLACGGGGGGVPSVAPAITTQPTDQTANAGSGATFMAAASGTPAPGFAWERSGDSGVTWAAVPAATSPTYTFTVAKADDQAWFRVKASNSAGTVASSSATLTVHWLAIGTQPSPQSVLAPAPASFALVADASPLPTYQWQSSPDGVIWTDVAGATGASHGTGATSVGDNGTQFRCKITNSVGTLASAAALLTVNAALVGPSFSLQPSDQAVAAGTNASFTVAAGGNPVPTYAWERSNNGGGTWTTVPGAASATYSFATVLADDGAQFRAKATNSVAVATSNVAHLSVSSLVPTLASINPTSGPAGTSVTLTGTNFSPTVGGNTVTFAGIAATVTTASATSLTVVAPTGASSGPVSVTTANGTGGGPVFTFTAATDVYITGLSLSGPAYWKNGTRTLMPPGCQGVRAIVASGTDVYVAGGDTGYLPSYWKNGVAVGLPVTSGHNGGEAFSIVLSGTDVYTAGFDTVNGAQSIPRCWKNNVPQSLAYAYGGGANSIWVDGTDVYVAGYQWSGPSGGNAVATLWKNGAPTALTDGTYNDFAYGVTVSGGDVYVSGTNGLAAKVWKNGVASTLNVPNATIGATAWAIYVTGTDVYVAGSYQDLAKYWKNGVMVDLTNTAAGMIGQEAATAITGVGTDVYILGNNLTLGGYGFWKNGTYTSISTGTALNGLFVQ